MGIDRPPNAMKIYPVGRQRWQGRGPLSRTGFPFGFLMRTGLIYRKSLGRACHRQGFSDARFDPGMIFESGTLRISLIGILCRLARKPPMIRKSLIESGG